MYRNYPPAIRTLSVLQNLQFHNHNMFVFTCKFAIPEKSFELVTFQIFFVCCLKSISNVYIYGNDLYKVIKQKRKHDTYLAYQIPRPSSSISFWIGFSLHRCCHLPRYGRALQFHKSPMKINVIHSSNCFAQTNLNVKGSNQLSY